MCKTDDGQLLEGTLNEYHCTVELALNLCVGLLHRCPLLHAGNSNTKTGQLTGDDCLRTTQRKGIFATKCVESDNS